MCDVRASRTCRKNSSERNAIKTFYFELGKCTHLVSVYNQGVLSKAKLASHKTEIELLILKLEKLATAANISLIKSTALLEDLVNVRTEIASLGESSSTSDDFFARVPPQKRKTVKDIFNLIYECSANKVVAKSLIDKIVERYLVEQNN